MVLLVCNGFPRRGHYANILHGKAVRFSEYDRMAAQFFQKYLDKIYQD